MPDIGEEAVIQFLAAWLQWDNAGNNEENPIIKITKANPLQIQWLRAHVYFSASRVLVHLILNLILCALVSLYCCTQNVSTYEESISVQSICFRKFKEIGININIFRFCGILRHLQYLWSPEKNHSRNLYKIFNQ